MSSAVSKFIKKTPIKSLQKYFEENNFDIAGSMDWSCDEGLLRKSLLDSEKKLAGEKLASLKSDAERISALTDELGQSILSQFVNAGDLEDYHNLKNEHDRSLWLFLKNIAQFKRAEDAFYTDTRRNGHMWDGFKGPKGITVSSDEGDILVFKTKLMDLFRAFGKIHVEISERTRADNEGAEVELIQIMVYREDLPSTQLAFEKENLVSKTVKPVKEVALTFEPDSGVIEVIAAGKENRESITKIFAETLLKSPIKGEKVPIKKYKIDSLLNNKVLSFDPKDGIESAEVTLLKVALPGSYNTLTLDVATQEGKNIYEVSSEYFGNNDPLQSGFKLIQARISIRFKPDDEGRKGKILHVTIRDPRGCDLKSKSQKEKLIGDKYLAQWGLVENIA